jgi:hypothetical protein
MLIAWLHRSSQPLSAVRARISTVWEPVEQARYDNTIASLCAQLDAATFAAAWAAGQAMTLEQAIAEALQTGAMATGSVAAPRGATVSIEEMHLV